MTVAGIATLGEGQLLKIVAESAALGGGTAGDSLFDTAAGTAPITSLIDFCFRPAPSYHPSSYIPV